MAKQFNWVILDNFDTTLQLVYNSLIQALIEVIQNAMEA